MLAEKKGFTLIELLTAITLMVIIAMVGADFSMNRVTEKEKASRFSEKVTDVFRSESLNNLTGRSIIIGGVATFPDSTRITVSTSTGISVQYLSGGLAIGTGSVLTPPFFGEEGYSIRSISLGGTDVPSASVDLQKGTGSTFSPSGTGMTIVLGYNAVEKKISFDGRSNRIDKE